MEITISCDALEIIQPFLQFLDYFPNLSAIVYKEDLITKSSYNVSTTGVYDQIENGLGHAFVMVIIESTLILY